MQKEAVIQYGPTGSVWRLVCDEGPWLNGSDLAPFPLAFFAAGAAASFISAFLSESGDRGIRVDTLGLVQDNFFTMEGSAVKGTMVAGVLPTELRLSVSGAAEGAVFSDIAAVALRDRSPVESCLRQSLSSSFAVRANDMDLVWPDQAGATVAGIADPAVAFGQLKPLSNDGGQLIRKRSDDAVESLGGAVGLAAEQKRTVHVRTDARLRDDGLKSIIVQCIRPAGSRFEFLSDDSRAMGGHERAPCGLVYFSAGVAFCFMTQIGRFAQITKQQIAGYRIVQDTAFRLARNCTACASAVETLVCLDSAETQDRSIRLVRMAEQTCYIHAAYRTPTKTECALK